MEQIPVQLSFISGTEKLSSTSSVQTFLLLGDEFNNKAASTSLESQY